MNDVTDNQKKDDFEDDKLNDLSNIEILDIEDDSSDVPEIPDNDDDISSLLELDEMDDFKTENDFSEDLNEILKEENIESLEKQEVIESNVIEKHILKVQSVKNIFTNENMKKWSSRLPDDINQSFYSDGDGEDVDELSLKLYEALDNQKYSEIPNILKNNSDGFKNFGRARRIRLISILAKRCLSIETELLNQDDKEGGDEGVSGAFGEVGVLFLEDLKIFVEKILQPRLAKQIINEQNLRVASEAIITLNLDTAPKI